jgi:hypothetical protein
MEDLNTEPRRVKRESVFPVNAHGRAFSGVDGLF